MVRKIGRKGKRERTDRIKIKDLLRQLEETVRNQMVVERQQDISVRFIKMTLKSAEESQRSQGKSTEAL